MSTTSRHPPNARPERGLDPFALAGFAGHPLVLALQDDGARHPDGPPELTREEQARLARLSSTVHRTQMQKSFHLRRTLASGLTGVSATDIQISHLADGAPQLNRPDGWAMSLSHKGPWTVVALSRLPAEIGVDVELVRDIDWRPMLKMICSEEERGAFETSGFEGRAALTCFFRMWTIKEAVLKSTRQGFRAGPKGVATPFEILTNPGAGELAAFGAAYEFWSADFGEAIFSLTRKRP
jgi:phosphopantetheinyl transferase